MNRYDVLGMVGLGMLGGGLWLRDPALALIVVGGTLLVVGVVASFLAAWGKASKKP